jgi:hypothetical protein
MARYDDLDAEQVMAQIGGLSQAQLTKVREYERGHQNRAEVLAGIAALAGEEPWPGYDAQSVPDLQASLDEASRELLGAVIDYERAHKNRTEVLQTAAHRQVMHPD